MLPSDECELAISNDMCMKKDQHEQEDSRVRSEYVLSQLSPQQYESLFSGFESHDLYLPSASLPQFDSQPDLDGTGPRQAPIDLYAPLPQSDADGVCLTSPWQVRIASNSTASRTALSTLRRPLWIQSWVEVFLTPPYGE